MILSELSVHTNTHNTGTLYLPCLHWTTALSMCVLCGLFGGTGGTQKESKDTTYTVETIPLILVLILVRAVRRYEMNVRIRWKQAQVNLHKVCTKKRKAWTQTLSHSHTDDRNLCRLTFEYTHLGRGKLSQLLLYVVQNFH